MSRYARKVGIDYTPREVAELLQNGQIQLIDVRQAYEHEAGRIAGDRHIELASLASEAETLDRERPVVFYCRSGSRSAMATEAFHGAGFNAHNMTGGLLEWEATGLPLEPDGGYVAVPAALAGKKAVSGQQTLQIKARLTPSRAGATHVTFGFHYDYRSTHPGEQPPYNAKTITLVLARGLVLDPTAAPSCKRSQIDKAKGDVSKCPRRSIVGHGSVVANAAPTLSTPITGTVTVYNAVNNLGQGQPKGTRNLILWVKSSVGVNAAYPFRVLKGRGGRMELQTKLQKPKTPGVTPGSFTIQTVDLSMSHSGRKPFITNPSSCRGSWPFALRVVNYFNQPSVTAHDRAKCRS